MKTNRAGGAGALTHEQTTGTEASREIAERKAAQIEEQQQRQGPTQADLDKNLVDPTANPQHRHLHGFTNTYKAKPLIASHMCVDIVTTSYGVKGRKTTKTITI